MKKITTILTMAVVISAIFYSCKKTETAPDGNNGSEQGIVVEKKNMSLINKFTGTNCYYCGDWGWTFFADLIDEHHGKDAVCIGSYSQNSYAKLLINDFATAMDKRLPVTAGYPTFSGNFYDAWKNAKTLQDMKDNILMKVDEQNAAAVIANSGLEFTIEGENIKVNTRTRFFEAAEGEYNLSVVVLEDGVIANQAGPNGGANASHHKVLRSSNGNWGVNIANGTIEADTKIDKEVIIAKDPAWNMDNVELATIIWKKNGTSWDFVNAHLHKN